MGRVEREREGERRRGDGGAKLDAVNRMDALGRERSGIEWKELKVITFIFMGGRADRKNATARGSQVCSNGNRGWVSERSTAQVEEGDAGRRPR